MAGQRIAYRVNNGVLEVSYWPRLDNAAGVTPAVYGLVAGVTGFRVAALTPTNTLSDRWPVSGAPPVPRGVQIELTLDDSTRIERWFALR